MHLLSLCSLLLSYSFAEERSHFLRAKLACDLPFMPLPASYNRKENAPTLFPKGLAKSERDIFAFPFCGGIVEKNDIHSS